MKMTDTCWCVCYNNNVENRYFNIECVYYGEQAKEYAIKTAIDMNIEDIKELRDDEEDLSCEELIILNDTNMSNEEKLQKYIDLLKFSNGYDKYITCAFYNIKQVPITLT